MGLSIVTFWDRCERTKLRNLLIIYNEIKQAYFMWMQLLCSNHTNKERIHPLWRPFWHWNGPLSVGRWQSLILPTTTTCLESLYDQKIRDWVMGLIHYRTTLPNVPVKYENKYVMNMSSPPLHSIHYYLITLNNKWIFEFTKAWYPIYIYIKGLYKWTTIRSTLT